MSFRSGFLIKKKIKEHFSDFRILCKGSCNVYKYVSICGHLLILKLGEGSLKDTHFLAKLYLSEVEIFPDFLKKHTKVLFHVIKH